MGTRSIELTWSVVIAHDRHIDFVSIIDALPQAAMLVSLLLMIGIHKTHDFNKNCTDL